MVRPTVPVTDLRALRYICRGPCGAWSGKITHSHPAGADRLTDGGEDERRQGLNIRDP